MVNTILELASEMVEYRKSLSQLMFSKLQDLGNKPVDMTEFCESYKERWWDWKKNGDEKEESSLRFSRSP